MADREVFDADAGGHVVERDPVRDRRDDAEADDLEPFDHGTALRVTLGQAAWPSRSESTSSEAPKFDR